MNRSIQATALALILLASGSARSEARSYQPKVGMRHPDFTLPRIDDRAPMTLSSLRGKKVLLIHFASW